MNANAAKTHCVHGHPYAGDNLRIRLKNGRPRRECVSCQRTQALKLYYVKKANGTLRDLHTKESKKRAGQVYSRKHRDQINAYRRMYRKRNADRGKNERLKKAYGITLQEYRAMYEAQGGKCAICGANTGAWRHHLVVDHCHVTKKIRGLLCHPCNTAIGHLKDNPELLRKAAQYLENYLH